MARKAGARAWSAKWRIGAGCGLAATLVIAGLVIGFGDWSVDAKSRRSHSPKDSASSEATRPRPAPDSIRWPLEIPDSQYEPIAWSEVAGWVQDDQLAAFTTFRVSCAPIMNQRTAPVPAKFLGTSLRASCKAARAAAISDNIGARIFFEQHFRPLRISRLGEEAGFVTGYYEPVVEGSRKPSAIFNVPVYRRPSNLFVRGFSQASLSLPNKGDVFRKIGRRKLVPYYDRAQIEDGAIAGRGLEVVWLKSQTDLLFIQIQGSARIQLEDGSMVRINYEAHNGYPYTPVGRILIERNIVPREQMSMQRIRQYMEQNPGAAAELRRQNRSFVFFREVNLSDKDEAVGAQGVPLTPGRSIAVDRALHVYGTPFFIDAQLPMDSDTVKTPFRHLMVAQDTGSAIIGPARADIYFGAGNDAGRVAGRIKDAAQFIMLLPKDLDPLARGKTVPLPDARPSAKIAKLFPQQDVRKDLPKETSKDGIGTKDVVKGQPKASPAPPSPGANAGQITTPKAVSQIPSSQIHPSQIVSEEAPSQAVPLPAARPEGAPDATSRAKPREPSHSRRPRDHSERP